jgi:hypothetical protein
MSIIAALILAILVALLFAPGYRTGSFTPLILLFFILFLAGLAGSFWIVPFGPVWWGISWFPMLSVIVICAVLFSIIPPGGKAVKHDAEATAAVAISWFIWLILILLAIAVITGYWTTRV